MAHDLTCVANVSLLFNEVPLAQRPGQARAAGFGGIEVQFLSDADVDTLAGILPHAGIPLTLLNADAGDMSGGDAGFAGVERAESRFDKSIDQVLERASRLGCNAIHVLAGKRDEKMSLQAQLEMAASRYSNAATRAAPAAVTVMIEPLSVPGYLVSDLTIAAKLVEMTDPAVSIQFDYFHVAAFHDDPAGAFQAHHRRVGHIQLAHAVSRNEPDPNEPKFGRFIESLIGSAYTGKIGFEYQPKGDTREGLRWAQTAGLL